VLPPKDVPAKQTKATRRLFLFLRAGIKSNICSTTTAVADPFPEQSLLPSPGPFLHHSSHARPFPSDKA
jgi:hypothetical protein